MFANRIEAGELLAKKLFLFKNDRKAIIVTIPNGGVLTAYPIARALNLPIELQFVKKITHPDDETISIGTVGLNNSFFNEESGVTGTYFEDEARTYSKLLAEKHKQFTGTDTPLSLSNRTVLLVDDGMQSGSTMKAALRLIKEQKPAQIVLAIPIAPKSIVEQFKEQVDEIICLKYYLPDELLKMHYQKFEPVKDSAVVRLLKE